MEVSGSLSAGAVELQVNESPLSILYEASGFQILSGHFDEKGKWVELGVCGISHATNIRYVTFIVAPCIMESIYCSFTNNCTFY